jgi:hypothetical protein
MPRGKKAAEAVEETADEAVDYPSAEERKGMRAHDTDGNVRPAAGRWDLHEPAEESTYVRTEIEPEESSDG